MIVRVGFLVAASIAAYAFKQVNDKRPPSSAAADNFLLLSVSFDERQMNLYPNNSMKRKNRLQVVLEKPRYLLLIKMEIIFI